MILIGDCLEVMKTLDADSIDAIVTDPPYGISFMGKNWDSGVPGVAFWREALRVAKPGCHILAAGGSRTYHRLAVAIEDAGWEIRDCVLWLYGSGFPKSHDVSKAIDREAGAEREVVGKSNRHVSGKPEQRTAGLSGSSTFAETVGMGAFVTAPTTESAKQWQGWGTALKPAFEPFILARKPLDGTVAANVQRHGTGGINVDGCRVGTDAGWSYPNGRGGSGWHGRESLSRNLDKPIAASPGRWPANVIHDGSDEVVGLFPEQTSGTISPHHKSNESENRCMSGKNYVRGPQSHPGSSGSAARFFYCAKANRSEREAGLDGMEEQITSRYAEMAQGPLPQQTPSKPTKQASHHPTVKPVALMSYLCRLITPPNGTILDPFCGSGSTGVAAIREGFKFIGIELNPDYAEIATRRIDHERHRMPLLEAIR